MDQNPDGSNDDVVNEDLLDEESDCDNGAVADGAMAHQPYINPADFMITDMKVEVMHFSYFEQTWFKLDEVINFLLKGDSVTSGEVGDVPGQAELSDKHTSKSGVKVFIYSE